MKTHILGFPSIGRHRELKQALESFWNGSRSAQALITVANDLKKQHWGIQCHVRKTSFDLLQQLAFWQMQTKKIKKKSQWMTQKV